MAKRVLILALASLTLAGCQSSVATGPIAWNSPTVVPLPATPSATSSTPAPGTHIQWNAPIEVPNGSASGGSSAPPSASEVKPNPAPAAPGSVIHWNSNGTAASVGAPPPSSPPPEQVSPPPPGTVVPIPPPVPLTPAQPGAARATGPDIRWRTAVEGDEIRVEIVDPASHYRVQQVMLVSPSGQEIAAKNITRYTANADGPYYSNQPTFGIGGFGGSRSGVSLGIGTVFPLGSSPPPPEDFDRRFARTVAVVYLPDPKAYQRNADRWSVRARLIDPAQVAYTVTFPAPRPPNS